MFTCEECHGETAREDMSFADWGDVCVDCEADIAQTSEQFWAAQYLGERLDADAYDLSDPKHPAYTDRLLEAVGL